MSWILKGKHGNLANHAEKAAFMTFSLEKQKDILLYLNCFTESEPGYINLNASQKTVAWLKFLGKLKYYANMYFTNKFNLS